MDSTKKIINLKMLGPRDGCTVLLEDLAMEGPDGRQNHSHFSINKNNGAGGIKINNKLKVHTDGNVGRT